MFILNRKDVRALLLVFLFGISILIRLPDLRSSLNRESEWQTAHVLTTLSIWKDNGITKHFFSPVWTFNTPADRYTNSLGGIKDKDNFTYYTSYPPFGFIFPFTILQLFDKSDWVYGLRIISLAIHFLCALLIFLIVAKLFRDSIRELFYLPAYVGFCIYTFSTGNLWFHGNFYFADSLVHLFILSAIYAFVLILESPAERTATKNTFLFLSVFLGVYTEWLAVFVSGSLILYFGYRSFKNKVYWKYTLCALTAIILSLGLTIYQYSSIAGFETLKQHSILKYNSRSGFNEAAAMDHVTISDKHSFHDLYNHYLSHYNYLGLLTLVGSIVLFVLWYKNRRTKKIEFNSAPIVIFCLLIASILVHHLLFFNFTVIHDVSTLKLSLPLSLFLAYVMGLSLIYFSHRKKYLVTGAIAVCLSFIFLSAKRYYLVNSRGDDPYHQEKAGRIIAGFNAPDEIVFTNIGVSPIMMWYSQRNPIMAKNEEESMAILQTLNYPAGVFFRIDRRNHSHSYEKIPLRADIKP